MILRETLLSKRYWWLSLLISFVFFVLMTTGLPATDSSVPDKTVPVCSSVWLDQLNCEAICTTPYYNRGNWAKMFERSSSLQVNGKTYSHIITHQSPAGFVMELPGGKASLSTDVRVLDSKNSPGSLQFRVYGDGKLLWNSGTLAGKDGIKSCNLEFENIHYLVLAVFPDGQQNQPNYVKWLDTKVTLIGDSNAERKVHLVSLPYDENGKVIPLNDEKGREYLALNALILQGMSDRLKSQAYHVQATVSDKDRDPLDIILRRTNALCDYLQKTFDVSLTEEARQLASIQKEAASILPKEKEKRRQLFDRVFELRRTIALSNPLLDFKDILFIKRHYNPEPEKQGNHMCDQFFGFHSRPGGGLFLLKNAFAKDVKEQKLVNVLENATISNGRLKGKSLDSRWGFLAPTLSYDGSEVFFVAADTSSPRHSYTWTEDNCYHLFKVGIDGKGLTQLTDGPVNDIDPWVMPNGRVTFISERRGGFGRCHARPCPSYTLHSMEQDGSDIVCLSPHETNEWSPSVDHNGMIVYTRWDYVDRGFNQAHHPWITSPDGRDPRAIQGNYSENQQGRPHFETSLKAVPDSHKLSGTAQGHHTQYFGSVFLLDPNVEDDDTGGDPMAPLRRITPDQLFPESETGVHGAPANYGQPFPLSEEFYLVVYDAFSGSGKGVYNHYGLYLLDVFGNKILLYRDPDISVQCPWPVAEREVPPVIPHQTFVGIPKSQKNAVPTKIPAVLPKTGVVGVTNVYNTNRPFPEGTKIKELRIVQILPKTTWNCNDPWIGYGAEKGARRVLGTVPVEEDGSARFDMPVDIPVYFQALNEEGVAVQTMRSATYVKPGETLTCNGCHEGRHNTSGNRPSGYPTAFRHKPSTIQPDVPGSNPFNYPILVQTILDRHCVQCHEKESKTGKTFPLDRGPEGEHFFTSYKKLRPYVFVYASNNNKRMDPPITYLTYHGGAYDAFLNARTFPGKFGTAASPIWKLLEKGHYDVKLTPAEKRAFALWLDNNADFYGAYEYETLETQRKGGIVRPTLE